MAARNVIKRHPVAAGRGVSGARAAGLSWAVPLPVRGLHQAAVVDRKERIMFRIIFAVALAMHGLGHLLFIGNAWGYWKTNGAGHARLIGALGPGQLAEQAAGLLLVLPVAGFLAVARGYVAHQGWWSPLAVASAAISGLLVVFFWGGINTSSAVFALVFDAAVIAWVLWQGRAGVIPGS
jgi:hypothetical protein